MKKIHSTFVISFVLVLFNISAHAITHTVTVQDIMFTPASMTVVVGDTVKWTWLNGIHTTTSETIPVGAAAWSSDINSGVTSFSYPVTVAGTYNYQCNFHVSLGMTGSFTASIGSGISPTVGSSFLIVSSTLLSNELEITYKLEKGSSISFLLLDLSGKQLDNITPLFHTPGTYTETYSVGNLSKGMYLLEFRTADIIASRKIVVE